MPTSIKPTGMHLVAEQVRKSQEYFGQGEFATAAALLTRAKANLSRLNKWGNNPISAHVEALLRVMTEKANGS